MMNGIQRRHTVATTSANVAREQVDHRQRSLIGTTQRHYRLSPKFATARGDFTNVVVVPGEVHTFVYVATPMGEIADYEKLLVVRETTDPVAVLETLGYQVAEHSTGSSQK